MGVIFATGLCDGPCAGLYGAGPVSYMLHDCWRLFGRRTMRRLYAGLPPPCTCYAEDRPGASMGATAGIVVGLQPAAQACPS